MRISDWSSDVCSSDLARTHQLDRWRRCAVFLPGAMFCRIRWQANDYGTIRWQLMVMQACTPLDAAQRIPGVQPGARLLLHAEIGRASCRERVCQYVEISVVAVSLKKQQTKLRSQ